MYIRLYFDMVSYFVDADGNEYMTDDWTQEDVEEEVEVVDKGTVLEAAMNYAMQIAKTVVIDSKEYDYLDLVMNKFNNDEYYEIPKKIEGLKLTKTVIRYLRYDNLDNDSYDIEIDGTYTYGY